MSCKTKSLVERQINKRKMLRSMTSKSYPHCILRIFCISHLICLSLWYRRWLETSCKPFCLKLAPAVFLAQRTNQPTRAPSAWRNRLIGVSDSQCLSSHCGGSNISGFHHALAWLQGHIALVTVATWIAATSSPQSVLGATRTVLTVVIQYRMRLWGWFFSSSTASWRHRE